MRNTLRTNWRCPVCWKRGGIVYPADAEYSEIRNAVRTEHAAASPAMRWREEDQDQLAGLYPDADGNEKLTCVPSRLAAY